MVPNKEAAYQSVTVVVAQLSADGPVGVFFYLLLVRKHNGLVEPGELQLHTGGLLQRTRPPDRQNLDRDPVFVRTGIVYLVGI